MTGVIRAMRRATGEMLPSDAPPRRNRNSGGGPSSESLVALVEARGWRVAMATVNRCWGLQDHLARANAPALRGLQKTLQEVLDRTGAVTGRHGSVVRDLADRLRTATLLEDLAVVLQELSLTTALPPPLDDDVAEMDTKVDEAPSSVVAIIWPLGVRPWLTTSDQPDHPCGVHRDPSTGRLDVAALAQALFSQEITPEACVLAGLRSSPATITVFGVLWDEIRPHPVRLVSVGWHVQAAVLKDDGMASAVGRVTTTTGNDVFFWPCGEHTSARVLDAAAALADLPQPRALMLSVVGAISPLLVCVATYLDPTRYGWQPPPSASSQMSSVPVANGDVPWGLRWFPASGHWVLHRQLVADVATSDPPPPAHLPILPEGLLNVPTTTEVRRCPPLAPVRAAMLAVTGPDAVRDIVWRLDFTRMRADGQPLSTAAAADTMAILTYWCASPVLQPAGLYDRVRNLTALPTDATDRRLEW